MVNMYNKMDDGDGFREVTERPDGVSGQLADLCLLSKKDIAGDVSDQ